MMFYHNRKMSNTALVVKKEMFSLTSYGIINASINNLPICILFIEFKYRTKIKLLIDR